MSNFDITPIKFEIKLRYKIGREIHYIKLKQFNFETIRDSNMIDKEKQKIKNKLRMDTQKANGWSNTPDDFTKLKKHLKDEDKKNFQFTIPLSVFYFTFDNLMGFLNKHSQFEDYNMNIANDYFINKSYSIEDKINFLKTLGNTIMENINELIREKINENNENYVIQLQKQKNNVLFISDTSDTKKQVKLFNDIIKNSNEQLLYKLIYLIFNEDLKSLFNEVKDFNLENKFKFSGGDKKKFLKNWDNNRIIIFDSLEKIHTLNQNLIYLQTLNEVKEIDKEVPIPKIENTKINEFFTTDFNSFIIQKIEKVIDNIFRRNERAITENREKWNEYIDNPSKFFIVNGEEEKKDIEDIQNYFDFLQQQYRIDNEARANLSNIRYNPNRLSKYNTDETRKQIVKEYGKYVLSDEYYDNSDIDKLYSRLKSDTRLLSYIITYYNIFKILETFYLTNGCILYENFFQEVYNQVDGESEIKKSKKKIYVKVKSLKCIKYTEDLLRDSFENDKILTPIYEIEFEEIPIHSNLIFYINIIDLLNPNNKLQSAIDNLQQSAIDNLEQINKFEILKINSESEIYKQHNNSMFSKNKNIHPTKIFIDNKLNIQALVNKFDILKNNNKIFKNYGVETIEDALMIINIFNTIINEKEMIINENADDNNNELVKYIENFYIKRFYFEIDKHLFIDNKYAQIKNVKIRLLNKMTIDELKKNKLASNATPKFYDYVPSKTTRLAIDKKDSSYYVYLDIDVVFKNLPTDRIPIKDKINYGNNCINRANILDNLLYSALGINYPKKYLENKLRKKSTSNDLTRKKSSIKSIQSGVNEDKKKSQENYRYKQSGGNKNFTRNIVSNKKNKKNKTIKNLIHYYTI